MKSNIYIFKLWHLLYTELNIETLILYFKIIKYTHTHTFCNKVQMDKIKVRTFSHQITHPIHYTTTEIL